MKLFDDNMESFNNKGFGFSAVRPETLGATEYTLVTIAVDITGSVYAFADELWKMKKTIIESCKKHARADYLLIRMINFNSSIIEEHGFKPLAEIDPSLYERPNCTGSTALRDACFSSMSSINTYAKNLTEQDYLVNAIMYVITDGADNVSQVSESDVKAEVKKGLASEYLESVRTVLVGVNTADSSCKTYLENFKNNVGFDQYVDLNDASAQKLAKLGNFVSQSISSQSQALGTGGPSQAIVF